MRPNAWDPRIDEHPLVRAADALVREALEAVMAGAPVRRYGDALMVWLSARRHAREELSGRVCAVDGAA